MGAPNGDLVSLKPGPTTPTTRAAAPIGVRLARQFDHRVRSDRSADERSLLHSPDLTAPSGVVAFQGVTLVSWQRRSSWQRATASTEPRTRDARRVPGTLCRPEGAPWLSRNSTQERRDGQREVDDVEQVRAEVRFALNQLRVRNGQHEFETLTRMLARATVTRNLLPATGPVAAGGDQGRDFESYTTQLPGQVQQLGRELGFPDKAMVGFTCTLQQEDLRGKIRGDVDKIMGDGAPVEFVVAYCEVDIPVARRHAIEQDVHSKHGIRLVVFDGAAITEHLTDHATFWIAETYLHVPSRVLPPPPDRPEWYEQDLARWREDRDPIDSMGRLVDVAGCLHYACTTHEGRPDVPFWLEKLQSALDDGSPSMLRRRAAYEFIAAHVRGLGSLRPAEQHFREYLTASLESESASDLEDATLLLMYASAAFARSETDLPAQALYEYNARLQTRVQELLDHDSTPGHRCQLLDTLATLRLHPDAVAAEAEGTPYRASDEITSATLEERLAAIEAGELGPIPVPLIDPPGAVEALLALSKVLPEAPLFPVETLSRLLTLYTPTLVDEPGFDEVTAAIDRRVAEASGEAVAADRALERASALFNSRRVLAGLRYLHRARNGLFNGDARSRMVEATLATAAAYRELGLHAAAKYFGLLAAELCGREDLEQHSQGLAIAAVADYHQGNWLNATYLNCRALVSHGILAERAFDFEEHPWLSGAFFELASMRSLAAKLGAPYQPFVDGAISPIGADAFLDELQREALQGHRPWWDELDSEEHIAKAVEDLGQPPFGDASEHRYVRFSCLGVTWTVVFRNLYADTAVGERYAAALQVVLGHLAPHDPAFLPTRITVYVTAVDEGRPTSVEELPSTPKESRLNVQLPAVGPRTVDHINAVGRETLGAVTAAVVLASIRNDGEFQDMMVTALEDDLLSVVVFGVPYDLAWRSVVSEAEFSTWPRSASPLADPKASRPQPHDDLAMPITPGPGYDQEHSHAEVEHRYRDLPPRMIPTLDALRQDEAFAATLAVLREEGWSDWQLLLAVHNVAKNARLTLLAPATREEAKAMTKRFMAPEPPGEPMPTDLFTADALREAIRMTVGSSAMSWWKLTLRLNPLDSDATMALLRVRYGWATDDVDHVDPFVPMP